ncbi:hypothetical protein [Brasilonema sp. UFV-L1]|uniref:hypothetical protein n=1 Tax=Brasilonema sp. UFV-L1 TaxID=2234130 RepID=UPI00145EE693|nr:hypothetical protein [Brasilonema sp. UFV-L1]NMG09784.1 hypothetical protein [Brasilonema sp. UFV-L1]
MSKKAARPGRPSKLTEETKQKLLQAIKAGVGIENACYYAGVSHKTVREWVRRGEGTHERPTSNEFAEFAEELNRAVVAAEITLSARIMTASTNDWRAAAWWLERQRPERWANTQKIEVAVDNKLIDLMMYAYQNLPPEVYHQTVKVLADRMGERVINVLPMSTEIDADLFDPTQLSDEELEKIASGG